MEGLYIMKALYDKCAANIRNGEAMDAFPKEDGDTHHSAAQS